MGYYDEVYLKRINKDGYTRQERVMTRKEIEFDQLFLRDSQYQAFVYQINQEPTNFIVSLQPNKYNESQQISNILVSRSILPLNTGDILQIRQKISQVDYDKTWLILFKEDNIGKGYQNYKAICLDSIINVTNEYGDTIFSIPVKMVNATATFVQDYFTYYYQGYREPNRNLRFITQYQNFLQKDTYFEYKNKGWEITGIDNISIDNVAYVSISERLIREVEPRSSEDILVGKKENFFLNNT